MNKYCVYLHKDLNGVVRYVGEGTLQRAYSFARKDQPKYMDYFKDFKPVVEIIKSGLSKNEAEELEKELRSLYVATTINNKNATKKVKHIDYDFISQYLIYDETSSTFLRWIKVNPSSSNNVRVGDEAGSIHGKGYVYTMIMGSSFSNHRLVWVLLNKSISLDKRVDHIDGNRSNNKISNLRLVTDRENSLNKRTKIPVTGYRNISRLLNSRGDIFLYNVRWFSLDTTERNSKLFSVKDFNSVNETLLAAYNFRESLILSGILNSHIKDGEVKL